jgi:hypothetical protein
MFTLVTILYVHFLKLWNHSEYVYLVMCFMLNNFSRFNIFYGHAFFMFNFLEIHSCQESFRALFHVLCRKPFMPRIRS